MGVVDKNGVGDGIGLSHAGGTAFVLSLLEFETDLTAADIVSAARSAHADLAHETTKAAGAAIGITTARGSSLNLLGGAQSIAEAAAAANITPDELVETHAALHTMTATDEDKKLVQELLDALQVRGRSNSASNSARASTYARGWTVELDRLGCPRVRRELTARPAGPRSSWRYMNESREHTRLPRSISQEL